MRLKHYFVILAAGIVLLAGAALFGTFRSHPTLFYVSEGFVVVLLLYLWHFYRKTIRPYDTLIGGIELVRELDLTTRLAPSGQHETDIIVRTFNNLLNRLRSEHLRLEEQYTFLNLLIEASPMGVIQCDLDGNITAMNPAAREMLSPGIEEALHALPLGQTTTMRLPGEPQLFRISHLSFPDRGFQHPFFLIESLTSEVRLAEKAAYERVIRMIAHEVNNSATGIVGLIEDGKWNNEDEATRSNVQSSMPNLQYITERLNALSAFVTRFADVVKIPQPQLQLCDLSEEVEACRPFLENLCTQAHVHIDFYLTDEAIPVHLDTVLFQQVLINIVKNAVESICPTLPDREGTITITVAKALPDSGRQGGEYPATLTTTSSSRSRHFNGRQRGEDPATLTTTSSSRSRHFSGGQESAYLIVTDNGRGISPEAAPHLFTPFFSTKPQGQGLGLLLIRDILTAHGCTFSLTTSPADNLTRFTIAFAKNAKHCAGLDKKNYFCGDKPKDN